MSAAPLGDGVRIHPHQSRPAGTPSDPPAECLRVRSSCESHQGIVRARAEVLVRVGGGTARCRCTHTPSPIMSRRNAQRSSRGVFESVITV